MVPLTVCVRAATYVFVVDAVLLAEDFEVVVLAVIGDDTQYA